MGVYVDDMHLTATVRGPGAPKGPRVWSHLMADTLPELEHMARMIGLSQSWLQNKPSGVHYDVTDTVRRRAIRFGAQEISTGSDEWRAVVAKARQQYVPPLEGFPSQ